MAKTQMGKNDKDKVPDVITIEVGNDLNVVIRWRLSRYHRCFLRGQLKNICRVIEKEKFKDEKDLEEGSTSKQVKNEKVTPTTKTKVVENREANKNVASKDSPVIEE